MYSTALARGDFFFRFRPSLLCDLRSFEWRVVLSEGLLDLVTRVVRDHSNKLDLLRVSPNDTPTDMIGIDKDGPSEVRPKVRPKDMIGRDEDGLSEFSTYTG